MPLVVLLMMKLSSLMVGSIRSLRISLILTLPNPTNGTMRKMATGSRLQCLTLSVLQLLVVVHGSGMYSP
jgi:hypothetical protein